jgi:hypothetical protein
MKTLVLTKKDFNESNEYIGKEDLSNFDGNIEISSGLGTVYFKNLYASGDIMVGGGAKEGGYTITAGGFRVGGHINTDGNI